MRIIVSHQTPETGLTLPINYHHILQSIIYEHMKGSEFADWHEDAYAYESRKYRMFTFSEITGKYKIYGKCITFYGQVTYKISSPNEKLINCIRNSICEKGILYGSQLVESVSVEVELLPIKTSEIDVRMISPICVYSTDVKTGKTRFYEPEERKFAEQCISNYVRKYQAYYGCKPDTEVMIRRKNVLPKHKKVTNYKGFMLSGWLGEYTIAGGPELLEFWYDTGIGSKNAEGFGMFDVVGDKCLQ